MISCKEELVRKIYRTDGAKSLVQRLCEIVTSKLGSDTVKFIACTCHKSSKQNKKEIAMKKGKSYAELEPVKKLFGEVLSLLQ